MPRSYPIARWLACHAASLSVLACGMAGAAPAAAPSGSPPALVAPPTYTSAAHDALIAGVRAGDQRWADILATLQAWQQTVEAPAARQRVLADLVVAAWEAGLAARAVAAAHALGANTIPTYALPAAVGAARAVPDRALQGELIDVWLAREPQAWAARVQHILWLVDTGEPDRAQIAIDRLSLAGQGSVEQQVALLELRGALAEARGEPVRALALYQRLQHLAPDHAYAARAPAFLLAGLGAPAAAHAHAREREAVQPGHFDALEQAELAHQALGQSLRWAVRERDQRTGEGTARHAALREVWRRFAPLRERVAHGQAEAAARGEHRAASSWQAIGQRLDFDAIIALAALGHYRQVIARYADLRAAGVAAPYPVLSAVAGAHQFERRSDLAVPLYEAALRDGGTALPVPSDVHVGLVFAYLDTARFGQAEALLRELEAATPPHLRLSPEAGRVNPDYTQVRHLRALALLYADRVAQAREHFDSLVEYAPLHAGARAGQAQVAQRQERPEHALALYEALATDHPDDVAARAGHVAALQSAGHHRDSRERLATLIAQAPEAIAVRNARRSLAMYRATQLDIEAGAARDGGTLANRDARLDVQLASPLLADGWRVFLRQVQAQARIDDARLRLSRTGVGLRWEQQRWAASAELHHASRGTPRQGVALNLAYRASDTWRLSAEADTHSLQTPWRARAAGIGARDLALRAQWLASDARQVSLRYDVLDLTDGNRRQGVTVDWSERWVSGPRFKLDTSASLQAGGYRRQDVPYFSPSGEGAARLAVRAEYLSWKRDDRRFVQAVEAAAGTYRQAQVGAGALWELRYVHEWRVGETVSLRYGVGTSRHPYDGVAERRHDVFVTLSMPLMP